QELKSVFQNGQLTLQLVNKKPVSISYRGHFKDQVNSTPLHNEDPSYGISAIISSEGTFLSAAAGWYPRLENENIHYHLRVTTPLGTEAVTSGRRTERSNERDLTHSSWVVDYPIYGLTLSAGRYQVFDDLSGNVPIYTYFKPESAHLAENYLLEARNHLRLYEELFGPYPFHKFAIVENFFPTGYGFPSWTLLGSSVIRLPFIIKTSLGHEIAHSWWGTGVRVDYAQGNWAEGLTTYVADYLYKERLSDSAALEYRLKILRDYAELVSADNAFPLAQFRSRNDKASQSIGYGKAAMLFHMLRKQVGDEVFWATLKKLAQEKMFKTIGWNDFVEHFSVATGKDYALFFDQWLTRKSGPKISLQNVEMEKSAEGYTISGLLRQTPPHYQLSVELQVLTTGATQTVSVKLTEESQAFALQSNAAPTALIADPKADLFRILDKKEIPPTINSIRSSTDLLVIKGEKYIPSTKAAKNLLGALRKQNLPINEFTAMPATELATHDLLIFGAEEKLKVEYMQSDKIQLAGKEIDLNSKSAFIVLPHPTAAGRVAAWFISADQGNDVIVARKIPHYGKYSYLLFEGVNNQIKGTLSPNNSPLRIDFNQHQGN
ncbi:MAG: M1 family aminopeptidase, partial [Desulfuromusa sp.]|nr:M1 family aminopeptidase [Desulfuromusa sp.]